MSMTKKQKDNLLKLTRTSVDDAHSSIRCRELSGNPLTVEECEVLLEKALQGSLRKMIESKARKAFRESVRDEKKDDEQAELIAAGSIHGIIDMANYTTLRRALYLAASPEVCACIRTVIKKRFPWGSCK